VGVVLESPAITGEVPEQELPKTSQEGRAIDPLRHSSGVVLKKPSGLASPGTAVAQGHARQETARGPRQRPADITGSHVTIAARSSLGSPEASRTSSIRVKPGGPARQLPGFSLDCQRDLSKNLAGPSGTEQGTGIVSKGVGLESKVCSP